MWASAPTNVCENRTGRTGPSTLQNTADEHSWSSIPKMSRSKTCCPLSATACGTFVGTISYWKGIDLAPEQGAEKHLRVSAINRFPAPLFAHFFWQGRKSGSPKAQLQCNCQNGSSGESGKAGRCGHRPLQTCAKNEQGGQRRLPLRGIPKTNSVRCKPQASPA